MSQTVLAGRLALLLVLLALAAPARAQWEILPTPRRVYNNVPLPAQAFATHNGGVVVSFDNYDATDGCGSCHATFASRDAGQTWALVRDPDGALFGAGSFARRGGMLYASHAYPSDAVNNGRVYRSADGTAWTRVASASGNGSLGSLQVTADGALWTRVWNNNTNRDMVMRSQAGSPWADATGTVDTRNGITPAAATDSRVFAATMYNLYVRETSAADWALVPYFVNAGPVAMDTDGQTVYAVATVSRTLPAPPYLAATYVHRSDDGGATWAAVASFPADRRADGVWAGTGGAVVVTLTPTASDPQRSLAISADRGASWTLVGPPQAREYALQARVEGAFLYAISSGDKRLYRRPLVGVAAEGSPGAADGLALSAGPNPAARTATLRFVLAESQTVRVALTDVLGRTVLTLDRPLGAGQQTIPLDVSGLAPGVYVARVSAGSAASSVRLTVAR